MKNKTDLRIPSTDNIIKIHDYLTDVHGSLGGMRSDPSYVSDFCKSYLSESEVVPVAAFILSRLAKGHYFVDGNKRTAYFSSRYFALMNGYDFGGTSSIEAISEMNKIAMLDDSSSRKYAEKVIERDIVCEDFSLKNISAFERLVLKSIAVSDGLSKG